MLKALDPGPNNGPLGYALAPECASDTRKDFTPVDHNLTHETRLCIRYTQDPTT
jgi:hypothetical protein